MRKHEKKIIMDSLQMLEEAHRDLRGSRPEEAAQILAGCGELSEQIIKYIASVAGPATQTAALLGEYIGAVLQPGANADSRLAKTLRSQLKRITATASGELRPDRMAVVFLPYKYGLFDSFESVYLAARADPACDVTVVPIPWCEKNPDRSLGKPASAGRFTAVFAAIFRCSRLCRSANAGAVRRHRCRPLRRAD